MNCTQNKKIAFHLSTNFEIKIFSNQDPLDQPPLIV